LIKQLKNADPILQDIVLLFNVSAYLSLVVVGMPNVGKSTIINSLRNIGVNKGRVAVSIL
jgi:ribosome biogenesis GTPase A